MSAPLKKRSFGLEESGSEDSDVYSSDNEEGEEYTGGEEIQVEFEGRNPCDSDYHGIKQLLHQLFLKAHINLAELTDLVISQNFIGSVVKQGDDSIKGDDEEDDDDDGKDVFGVTSVINLTEKKELECISQLRSLLVELSTEHGTDRCNTLIRTLLADETKPLGLIINERFVNIPSQISVPLLESLSKEIRRACDKKLPFEFSYYIFICKLYKLDEKAKNKKKKKGKIGQEQEIVWSNPEEELIDQAADARFEFCVKDDIDSGLSGNWLEDDLTMVPYRRVLILTADKLDMVINTIKETIES